jgi:tetratricopeptide (TPR) repeat protein
MSKFLFPVSVFIVLFLACNGNNETAKTTAPSDSIIFKDANGNVLSLADIQGFTGKIEYEIPDNIEVNPEASRLHQEGRQLGAEGKHAEAIEKLLAAMAIQPEWAYPPYDLAYTYSLMGDDVNALKYYELTDSLRPKGFFTCKTALWSLRAERDGKFPAGAYMTYMQIEWATSDKEKLQMTEILVDTLPLYAPAWMELSHLLDDNLARLDAIERGLAADPDPETKGMMLINKAAILKLQGHHDEGVKILGEVIFDPESTGSNVELAKTTLKTFYQ